MADLFERLFPQDPEEDKIAVHLFEAALIDYMTNNLTKAQIVAFFNLDATAEADLTVLLAWIDSQGTKQDKIIAFHEIAAVNIMAEAGARYTTKIDYKTRLGI